MTSAAPLLTRRATLQLALESSYRTEATITTADAIYVEDPDYSVEVEKLERNFTRDDLSPLAKVSGRKLASLKFTTEVKGNGLQNSGSLGNAPIISRLFRGCGYSLSAVAAKTVTSVFPTGTHTTAVSWVAGGTLTNTDVIAYFIEVTTGGASDTAQLTVTSDTAGEGSAAAAVTSGSPKTIGTKGLTLTPTWTGSLVLGQKWVVWLLPTGLKLDPVSSSFESLTMVLNMDGVNHKLLGCFGTFSINAEAGKYAKIEWTFTGSYEVPVDAALPACTYETTLPSQVELARLRVENYYAIVNAFTFDQGNDVQVRPDVSSADGYIGTRIVGRTPEGGIDPESELVANHDFWGKLAAATRMPFQMRIGSAAGNIVWFFAPCTQYSGLTYQDRNGIRTYDAGLSFSRTSGNDEFIIFLC